MPTPFACSPQYTQDIDDNYLMPIQVGSDQTEEGGLPQMKHIKFGLLKEYFKQNLSTLGTFRGVYTSALPDNLAVNDFFFAGATFTVDSMTFTIGNYYQYDVDGNWGEISLILSGVLTTASIVDDLVTEASDLVLSARQGKVLNDAISDINDTISDLEQQIDAIEGGITPKGDILSTNLPTADASNKGWQYYCTDLAKYAVSDGTQWVYFSNTMLTDIPDASDTGHALTNAKTTQMFNSVNGKISQHDARIQNLEEKAGDYVEVQYRGTNAVPTGKAHYGLVEKIVGKTRAWNQLVNKSVFSTSETINGITFTNNGDGSITVNGTATETTSYELYPDNINNGLNPIIGHKYLMMGCPAGGSYNSFILQQNNNGAFGQALIDFGNGVISPVAMNRNSNALRISVYAGATVNNKTFFPTFYDLTLIFGSGNEPATVADALAQLSALGQYNSYDAGSLVSTTVEGVESVGVNILDEIFEDGDINSNTGADIPSSTYVRTDFNRCLPNKEYRFKFSGTVYFLWYDAQKGYLGYFVSANGTETRTSPLSAFYIRVVKLKTNTGTTQICDNSLPSSVKTVYHPYVHKTLSLPSVTLRSAGSVADEYNPQTGVINRNTAYETITVDSLYTRSGNTSVKFAVFTSEKAWPSGVFGGEVKWKYGELKDGVDFDNTTTVNVILVYSSSTHQYAISVPYNYTQADAESLLNGEPFVYIPNEPTTETLSPVPNNTIYTEGGGTINTVQTQTPVIDNCLDVGYLAI